ncbi:MAG: metallophosphoesterase [Spirochaetales bacterium]|nr:metallophosphoesterase [Spirochaetales bacterium]
MEPFIAGPDSYFVLENVGVHSALFAFAAPRASVFHIRVASRTGHEIRISTTEYNFLGRIQVDGLEQGSEYTAQCLAGSSSLSSLAFKTLELPSPGPCYRFAVIADPHISVDRENRRGRLFTESRGLLRETLERLADERYGAVFVLGDITDSGSVEEVEQSIKILSSYPGRMFLIPGDHDCGDKRGNVQTGDPVSRLFPDELSFLRTWNGPWGTFNVLGLDTASGDLSDDQLEILKDGLSKRDFLIILSHHNLIRNPDLLDEDSCIRNHREATGILANAKGAWIIYCGHKNVPRKLSFAKGCQLNVSQLSHYPAGFLSVEVCGGSLLHQFVPIRSEALRSYSLRMLSRDWSPSFEPMYRYGSLEARSFILSFEDAAGGVL